MSQVLEFLYWMVCIFLFLMTWQWKQRKSHRLLEQFIFSMLIILYSALFVAGWIFVNNNHKFSFNTIEFWKKWPLLLSNLAGKGDCYFKLAVTTFSVLLPWKVEAVNYQTSKKQHKTTLGTHKPEVDMQYPQYFCCSKTFLLHANC